MENKTYYQVFKEKGLAILTMVVFFLILATIFTFIQPLKYEARSRLIIIQTLSTNDPYAIAKANETVGNILASSVASDTFFNLIVNSEFNIDRNYFGSDISRQSIVWKTTVAASAVNDTGILDVRVWHKDKTQADLISQAVSYVLKNSYSLFLSEKESVDIRVLDKAVVSTWPVKPNVGLNYLIALLVGLVFSFVYVYLSVDDKTDLSFFDEDDSAPANDLVAPEFKYPVEIRPGPMAQVQAPVFSPSPNLNYYQREMMAAKNQTVSQPKANGPVRTQIFNQGSNTPTDDLDLDIIIKSGSMANIFGNSNLKN